MSFFLFQICAIIAKNGKLDHNDASQYILYMAEQSGLHKDFSWILTIRLNKSYIQVVGLHIITKSYVSKLHVIAAKFQTEYN